MVKNSARSLKPRVARAQLSAILSQPADLESAGRRQSIALRQVAVSAAHRMRFGAYPAAGTFLRIPGIQIDVQPVRRLGHEALEEQGAEDRSGESGCSHIVQVGDLAAELVVVSRPQR